MQKSIIILDYGSQYTQLIARKVRELKFYAEIYPYTLSLKEILDLNPGGIILSGSPHSVYEKNAPRLDSKILDTGIPVLGICYGMQLITHSLGGEVIPEVKREYGKANLKIKKENALFSGVSDGEQVWMSHGDRVLKIPNGFEAIASTSSSPYAAIKHKKKSLYAVQFHPEVHHSRKGKVILKNFCKNICGLKTNWSMQNFAKSKIEEIRRIVGKERVILGLSGGVDSMVTAKLIHDAIGSQLTCVYVDNGLMRLNETEAVIKRFGTFFKIPLKVVHAGEHFLNALVAVTEPEKKRKIIGKLFVEEFKKVSEQSGHHEFLAQGTLYTDVIESVSVKGPSETIKSHHNRVEEIMHLINAGKVVEPLKELFKDEVRALGTALGMPHDMLYRHPFPGPGLAIRIIGEITKSRLELLRRADAILLEELKEKKYYEKVWQAFAVFLPVQSVGVMGDKRTYENVIALRVVESQDGMTADFAKLPYEIIGHVASRIINEIKGINRVVYDISSKPPATIEWE